ncbi:ATP-binding cassette domain-containing protein, partial [Clostridioides difficile]|uniref:ATP-binding cassette domain-containing protein n=1 Tax=Clostridioides difficile TaxID=1496 RepID=UPI002359E627
HNKEVLAGININIQKDEIFGLVGESGCGKSTICNLIRGLDKCDRGKIIFDNVDITNMKEKEMRPIRKNLQAVFQDSKSSLNPKMKVYDILNEPLKNYNLENSHRIKELVELVGLDENSLKKYPHEFSGGQRQRISIARSLALNPK